MSGLEPPACRLREVCSRATHALAAPMAHGTALTAFTTPGLSGMPFHERFHAGSPASSFLLLCVTFEPVLSTRSNGVDSARCRIAPLDQDGTDTAPPLAHLLPGLSTVDVLASMGVTIETQKPRPVTAHRPSRASTVGDLRRCLLSTSRPEAVRSLRLRSVSSWISSRQKPDSLPARSSRRGCRGWLGCTGARDPGHAR